ncbi:uncharacterized protein BDV14DRAFT_202813 [Aspergillus stella-maris]|uniref:uncharacterized protein n=1 Tax=Aspergillus stella-maris TaxID=1810926 RepID=UPI003CCD7C11
MSLVLQVYLGMKDFFSTCCSLTTSHIQICDAELNQEQGSINTGWRTGVVLGRGAPPVPQKAGFMTCDFLIKEAAYAALLGFISGFLGVSFILKAPKAGLERQSMQCANPSAKGATFIKTAAENEGHLMSKAL